jgi:tRNA(adenine34) deaminase
MTMHQHKTYTYFMDIAFQQAHEALINGEVPVGAVIVFQSQVVGLGYNLVINSCDPTAHAEIVAIRNASEHLQSHILSECDLYVTLEPCNMCAGAISLSRIRRLYFSAFDEKGGAVDHGVRIFQQSTCLHKPEVFGGIMESRGSVLLKDFFKDKRFISSDKT